MMVNFQFQYIITYAEGQAYDRKHILTVQITEVEHKEIIQGVLQDIAIKDIEEISDVISRMREQVEFVDRWTNVNGTSRSTPLKKMRKIKDIEYFLPDDVERRIRIMKDPIAALKHGKEEMTIYRSDGSAVTISSYFGEVSIQDSRKKNITTVLSSDHFIGRILN